MLTALVLLLSADCGSELFRIERSKNANVVVYEAKAGTQTALDEDDPVSASWILLASTGKRAPLAFFERLFAYGFEVRLDRKSESAILTLKALPGRTMKVLRQGACLVAMGSIAGAESVIKRVFVTTDERGPAPKVMSIEVFGVDPVSGEPRAEKIVAGK